MNEEAKPRVILVDDDEAVRTWLKPMLVSIGCEVVGEAVNGRDGIELFKKERPDWVLLDLHMPEVDGSLAADLIFVEQPDARIIHLSSIRSSEKILERLDAGAKYYLRKDAPLKEIKATLKELIFSDVGDH